MSVEETNRLRVSLGLKPLSMDSGKEARDKEQAARREKQAEADKQAKAAELAERVTKAKEKRQLQEHYSKVKTLGAAAPDVDDLAAWVSKSRTLEEQQRVAERAKAEKLARQFEEQEELDESDEEADGRALAGLKVRHNAAELAEGETMILTLADRNILDEKGDLDEEGDELENVRAAELKKREKAKKDAQGSRHQPLFEEDGKQRALLDKYDEAEEEAGMEIDETGTVDVEKKHRQEEIRRKLAAGSAIADSATTSGKAAYDSRAEYYTQEEMQQFEKPKKKKKKKLRKKEADSEVAVDIAALEADAAAAGSSDLGSRTSRIAQALAEKDRQSADAQRRQDRYNNALEKANLASAALRTTTATTAGGDEAADEDEADLYESLARARRAAQAAKRESADDRGLTSVASELAKQRAEDEARERAEAEQGGGLEFTEAAEFARSIQLRGPEEAAKPKDERMDYEQEEPAPPPPVAPKKEEPAPIPSSRWGNWVSAEADAADAASEDEEMPQANGAPQNGRAKGKPEAEEQGITRERLVGSGLAGALALLKDRNELNTPVEWSGRTNDMKPEKLMGLEDVYKGGAHEDKIAADVELALTQRDEYGRVMTPKERYRQLCYRFHGKEPSKNKKEKYMRKAADAIVQKRASTSEVTETSSLARLQHANKAAAAPYVVLTGNVKPGQSADPVSGYATVEHAALTPVLGGGQTPLLGDRKVEVMLGIKREGGHMPPPPARRPKTEH
ncbi:hypothetical protein WJX72_007494 [[Myrmecia] bisecta]|uniref:U4/U6.U5 tri-snRNP-associated protein 1 n=1 Tax=[Myrmecia] bisecta TaxID=41462 RepID=A0AAW1PAF0_9CHLO